MTKQNISSNGVPQGNAAHSTSENANNNPKCYAKIRCISSRGKEEVKVINLDGYEGATKFSIAIKGVLRRKRNYFVCTLYKDGEEIGLFYNQPDECYANFHFNFEFGGKTYTMHKNWESFHHIANSVWYNEVSPVIEYADESYREFVARKEQERAEAEKQVAELSTLDADSMEEPQEIYDSMCELAEAINEADSLGVDTSKLYEKLLTLFQKEGIMDWLKEEGEISCPVECEDFFSDYLTFTLVFQNYDLETLFDDGGISVYEDTDSADYVLEEFLVEIEERLSRMIPNTDVA